MGIELTYSIASNKYSRSKQMTGPLIAINALQTNSLPDVSDVDQITRGTLRQKSDALKHLDLIDQYFSSGVLRNLQKAREQGASGPARSNSKSVVMHRTKRSSKMCSRLDTIDTSAILPSFSEVPDSTQIML